MMCFYSGIYCMDLFVLPNNMILDIASLLLSAATVDRFEGKVDQELYCARIVYS